MPTPRRRQVQPKTTMKSPSRPRRSTQAKSVETESSAKIQNYEAILATNDEFTEDEEVSDKEEANEAQTTKYILDGVEYDTYRELADAKQKRNEARLKELGLWHAASALKQEAKAAKAVSGASQRGIKRKKVESIEPVVMRKSSRLSGNKTQLVSLDYFVTDWNRNNSTVVQQEGEGDDKDEVGEEKETFFKGRVNDGSELTLEAAIDLNDAKWIRDNSLQQAEELFQDIKAHDGSQKEESPTKTSHQTTKKKTVSPTSVVSMKEDASSVAEVASMVNNLSIDNEEWVAKVTPDRIYSVTVHPNESKLVCCAGDKQGYVGLWSVDAVSTEDNDNNHGVSLFRPHSRPICCLEWLNNDNMVTASYDGSVRRLNVEKGVFEEIFATYDDSDTTYSADLGYGMDQGYRYWTQSVTIDPRYNGMSNPGLFVSTSFGEIFHADLRNPKKERITFHETVSDKKVNSVSLHPNGHILATGGNDGIVRLFDLRKMGDTRGKTTPKKPKALCQQAPGLSVSSAFFSPSGKSLLTTSFANRLDLTEDAHLKSGGGTIKPTHSIRHNNQTGRWLTTFQAKWHPSMDIFCCGSMNQPRCMEIFDSQGKLLRAVTGESLTSVMSRTCFHPSTDRLIMIGGNSSGRVVAVR